MDDRATVPDVPMAGALARLADEVLPALIAWLDVSELGELEVRHDGWRVRLRRSLAPAGVSSSAPAPGTSAGLAGEVAQCNAVSPAVGYYLLNDRTPVGRAVTAGDVVGWVEVLGVRQEVVAPCEGIVGRRLAEPGQAVEYGQELLVIDPARRAPASSDDGDRPAAAAGA